MRVTNETESKPSSYNRFYAKVAEIQYGSAGTLFPLVYGKLADMLGMRS